MDKFVVDAGPFIHLEQINQLKLLKNLPQIYIPAGVISEIKQGDKILSSLKDIKHWPNAKITAVQRKSIGPKGKIIRAAGLQRGETDCIYLAIQIQQSILLTDDMHARITAEKLSIEVHGSIGLIAYGFRRKWISLKEAEESLILLYHRSNLFITYAIIEEAIRNLKRNA